jgi:hypothetical protein
MQVRTKAPGDPTTHLVVYLAGRVPMSMVRHAAFLEVCGLPESYGEDGAFEVRRSFPRPGTLMLRARVLDPDTRDLLDSAQCQVVLKSDPEESKRLEARAQQAFETSGPNSRLAFHDLLRSADLRTAPALWRFIDSHPGDGSDERMWAVLALGEMRDLDSVPRLVGLLDDKTVDEAASNSLKAFGFFGVGLGGLMQPDWHAPLSATPSWSEWKKALKDTLPEWRRRERQIRRLMHQ